MPLTFKSDTSLTLIIIIPDHIRVEIMNHPTTRFSLRYIFDCHNMELTLTTLVNEMYVTAKSCLMATIGSPKTKEADMGAETVDKHYIDTIMLTLMTPNHSWYREILLALPNSMANRGESRGEREKGKGRKREERKEKKRGRTMRERKGNFNTLKI